MTSAIERKNSNLLGAGTLSNLDEPSVLVPSGVQLTPPLEPKRQKTGFGTTGVNFDPCFSRLAKLLGSSMDDAGLSLT